jgi:hypothetical protein
MGLSNASQLQLLSLLGERGVTSLTTVCRHSSQLMRVSRWSSLGWLLESACSDSLLPSRSTHGMHEVLAALLSVQFKFEGKSTWRPCGSGPI